MSFGATPPRGHLTRCLNLPQSTSAPRKATFQLKSTACTVYMRARGCEGCPAEGQKLLENLLSPASGHMGPMTLTHAVDTPGKRAEATFFKFQMLVVSRCLPRQGSVLQCPHRHYAAKPALRGWHSRRHAVRHTTNQPHENKGKTCTQQTPDNSGLVTADAATKQPEQ